MINFDDVVKKTKKDHSPNWPQIPDHPYRILIIGDSGSGKTNSLLNLINQQSDIDNIYLYAKDPYEAKYQFLIKKREDVGTKQFNDSKAFIEYSNNMNDIYKNIEDYDVIADMLSNQKLNPIVTKLFIRGRKLNICIVFIIQSYFAVPQNIRLNSTHYFIMKIPNKRKLQQTVFNYLSDSDFKDFMNLYKNCTAKPYSFLVTDATLASDNPSHFRKNIKSNNDN